ncbi:MAG: Yip1 family protein [Chloroflexota bacterium]
MTETSVQPAPRFNLARLFAILFRPRRAFGEIAGEGKPSWVTPLIVASLAAILVVVVGGYVKSRAAMQGEVELPPDWQYWSPDMQEQYMQGQQMTQSPAFLYVVPAAGALIGLWLGWLILGGLLHLGSTLAGGRGSMGGTLTITAWAGAPFIVRDLLRAVFVLASGHAIRAAGLSGFAEGMGMITQLLARADLFVVWNAILLILGFRIVDNLPAGKAAGAVLAVLILVMLAQAGIASFGANLGSTVNNGF